jgi:hypothetical protein
VALEVQRFLDFAVKNSMNYIAALYRRRPVCFYGEAIFENESKSDTEKNAKKSL